MLVLRNHAALVQLRSILPKCKKNVHKNSHNEDARQVELGYQPTFSEFGQGSSMLSTWQFDQAATSHALA